jgi:hypothetical protein
VVKIEVSQPKIRLEKKKKNIKFFACKNLKYLLNEQPLQKKVARAMIKCRKRIETIF